MQLVCLIIGPRRAALIGAIAAVVLVIIFYPQIAIIPFDVNKVPVDLTEISMTSGSVEEQRVDLRVTFTVGNNNDVTLTTSKIDYELFADGASLGSYTLSYEDVPPNGRPPFFPGGSTPVSDTIQLEYSDNDADAFNKLLNNEEIAWRVQGTITLESALTQLTKDFSDEL
jgi:LEA14-like dessication related protein